ncbi:hypothetical protein R3P38DRAFT_3608716 [Favolaschia claudopus]|uniref:Uncharacterized protein n=1 Tax=Favolaschia claudopus TaxID=2862362 RepID=A0AAW0DJ37_9AGAR
MSDAATSFGTTISSGIQDLSAVLSLFGTEECQTHVGSALRGGGRGGFLYAAITPLSIFGSLGPAKAALTILVASIPHRGAVMLLSLTLLVDDGNRYEAEKRLIALLKKHYMHSSAQIIEFHPPSHSFPVSILRHSWNLHLLLASALVTVLGVMPYIHFFALHHLSFPIWAIIFPVLRVRILQQRILFTGLSNVLNKKELIWVLDNMNITWDETRTSEQCLSSLYRFLQTAKTIDLKFIDDALKEIGQVLDAGGTSPPTRAAEVSAKLRPYLDEAAEWVFLFIALVLGFFMTVTGYIGCFTIVQNSRTASDPYIWIGLEVALALMRLGVWAWNPAWDDSHGIHFVLKSLQPQPPPESETVTSEQQPQTFILIDETEFWEAFTAQSGIVAIDQISRIPGFRLWYSWHKETQSSSEVLSLVLEAQYIGGLMILCTMENDKNIKFYQASISAANSSPTAERGELLDEGVSSVIRLPVFEHYHFVLQAQERSNSQLMQVSWTLSHSFVVPNTKSLPDSNDPLKGLRDLHRPRHSEREDVEHCSVNAQATNTSTQESTNLRATTTKILEGKILTFPEFRDGLAIAAKALAAGGQSSVAFLDIVLMRAEDLDKTLSNHLLTYVKDIYKELSVHENLIDAYDERWQRYRTGVLILFRLFKNLDVDHNPSTQESLTQIKVMLKKAVDSWRNEVLLNLFNRLGAPVAQKRAKDGIAQTELFLLNQLLLLEALAEWEVMDMKGVLGVLVRGPGYITRVLRGSSLEALAEREAGVPEAWVAGPSSREDSRFPRIGTRVLSPSISLEALVEREVMEALVRGPG